MKKFKIVLKVLGWGFLLYAIVAISISFIVNIADAPRKPIREAVKQAQLHHMILLPLPNNIGQTVNVEYEEDDKGLIPDADIVYYFEHHDKDSFNAAVEKFNKEYFLEYIYLTNSIFDKCHNKHITQDINMLEVAMEANVGLVFDICYAAGEHHRVKLTPTDIHQLYTKERLCPALAIEKLSLIGNIKFPIKIDKGIILKKNTLSTKLSNMSY